MAFVLNRTLGPIVSRRLLQRVITTTASEQQYRFRSRLPYNTVILFVPQQEAWVVERMGKFYKTLSPVSSRLKVYFHDNINIYFLGFKYSFTDY